MKGNTRKIVVVAVYIPPKMTVDLFNKLSTSLTENILKIKDEIKDPYIIITGNLNQRSFSATLATYHEISEVKTPVSRGQSHLDLIYTNFGGDRNGR